MPRTRPDPCECRHDKTLHEWEPGNPYQGRCRGTWTVVGLSKCPCSIYISARQVRHCIQAWKSVRTSVMYGASWALAMASAFRWWMEEDRVPPPRRQ